MLRILKYLIPLLLLGALFTSLPYQWLTLRTVDNARIKDKQISTESDKKTGTVESTYLIYTNRGVFRNSDALWHFKFNSSDIYGNLDEGAHYRLKVYGWRIPILSMYPNIVRAKEVRAETPTKKKKDTK